MKKAIAILLLFSLTFQCFSELTTVIGFEIHKDYIAETLCVNKDHPEMDCEGSCYLQDQMQQNENHKDTNGLVKTVDLVLFCTTEQDFDLAVSPHERVIFSELQIGDYSSPSFPPDRPPKV